MAFLTQAMNQFTQAPILGAVDLVPSPNVIAAQIDPDSVATAIQNGSVVKLVAGAGGAGALPLVDVTTGPTDGPVFGVIPYNNRKNLYSAGDVVQVARQGTYIYLKSSEAIDSGEKVTTTAATTTADPLVAAVSVPTTQYVTGEALDTCTGANQLLRVSIAPSLDGAV